MCDVSIGTSQGRKSCAQKTETLCFLQVLYRISNEHPCSFYVVVSLIIFCELLWEMRLLDKDCFFIL